VWAFTSIEPVEAKNLANRLISRLSRKDIDSDTRQSLIAALGAVAGRLDAPAAAEAAKDLRARLDSKDIDSVTRRSLILALGAVAGRLDAPAAAEAAKDLRARLDSKDIDSQTRQSLILALDAVAGRLDAPAAAEAAKDLRARLDSKDIDSDTRRSLIDALALIAPISGPLPTNAEIPTLRLVIGSIAWPLRDPSESPAWARLEAISGENFDGGEFDKDIRRKDIHRLLAWLQKCCRLAPTAARPPFG
jgi:hypothetical protein